MRAMPAGQSGYRINGAGGAAETRDRGVCVSCGAHVPCTVGLATVSGCCSVCGGVGIKPIGQRPSPDIGRIATAR